VRGPRFAAVRRAALFFVTSGVKKKRRPSLGFRTFLTTENAWFQTAFGFLVLFWRPWISPGREENHVSPGDVRHVCTGLDQKCESRASGGGEKGALCRRAGVKTPLPIRPKSLNVPATV
jgi:hypothetical protein